MGRDGEGERGEEWWVGVVDSKKQKVSASDKIFRAVIELCQRCCSVVYMFVVGVFIDSVSYKHIHIMCCSKIYFRIVYD